MPCCLTCRFQFLAVSPRFVIFIRRNRCLRFDIEPDLHFQLTFHNLCASKFPVTSVACIRSTRLQAFSASKLDIIRFLLFIHVFLDGWSNEPRCSFLIFHFACVTISLYYYLYLFCSLFIYSLIAFALLVFISFGHDQAYRYCFHVVQLTQLFKCITLVPPTIVRMTQEATILVIIALSRCLGLVCAHG